MGHRALVALTVSLLLFAAPHAVFSGEDDLPAYLALGDSIAFGVGATNPAAEGYVGLTHFNLTKEDAPYADGLHLINTAEPGATSADVLEPKGQLDKALEEIELRANDDIEGNEVEVISIDIGGNDLLQLAESDSPCIIDTGSRECRDAISDALSGLQENLTTILTELREAAPEARIYTIDLYNPYSGTGDAREVLAGVAVQQVNGVINATSANKDLGVTLVTIFELFLGRGEQWVATDLIHPNNAGHEVISEALVASIEERPVRVPEDLASVPTGPATGEPAPAQADDGGDGLSGVILYVVIGVAFAAGLAVSGTYFWARGRASG
jgi:lysophospholipase L1-like esterase